MVDIGISDAVSHRSRKVPRELFDLRGRDGPVATSPPRVPRAGPEKVIHEWRDWLRVLTAWSIAVPALLLMKLLSGWSLPTSIEHLLTDELWSWVARLTLITVAWLITGPVYASIFKATTVAENGDVPSRRELA